MRALAYEVYYGTREKHIVVTPVCLSKCRRHNAVCLPSGDHERTLLFSDPAPGLAKSLFLHCRQTFQTEEYGPGRRVFLRCGPGGGGGGGLWVEGDGPCPEWATSGGSDGRPYSLHVPRGDSIQQVASVPPTVDQDAALADMVAAGWAATRWLPFEPASAPTVVAADMGVFIELLLYEVNAPVRDQRLVETCQIFASGGGVPPLAASLMGFLGFAEVEPGFWRRGLLSRTQIAGLAPPPSPVEIVVARHEEPLGWLSQEPFMGHPATVYNKGATASDFCPSPNIMQEVHLANVGREAHTYLHHVVERWDTLAETTVFLPGSCDLAHKGQRAAEVVAAVARHPGRSVLSGDRYGRPLQDEYAGFEAHGRYVNSHVANRGAVAGADLIQGARLRPFAVWYKHHFGDFPATVFAVNAIFAICRRDIQQHPLHYYRGLLAEVSGSANPEEGHFFERAWEAVFGPLEEVLVLERPAAGVQN